MVIPPLSTLSGWGGHSARGHEHRSENLERISNCVSLSRGLGRSYGDASLPACETTEVLNTTRGDRILLFDQHTGLFRAEAGFLFS